MSIDDDWVTVDGVRYVPEAPLKADIARLQELLRGTGANRYWEGRWRDADAENQKLRAALAIMWHAYDTDNRPPHGVVKIAKECYDAGKALAKEGK